MSPLVSICIPTYNGAGHIRPCIRSALAQTFESVEILIVDDGSSDATLDIVRDEVKHDPRVRMHRNESNLGLVGNWNRSIELAKGEWIKFLFQDDLLEPDCIEAMLAAKPAWLAVCDRGFLFDGVSERTRRNYQRYEKDECPAAVFGDQTDVDAELFCRKLLKMPTSNFVGEPIVSLIHRRTFETFGRYDPRYIQLCDFEFYARVACQVGMTYVPRRLAWFRVHDQSTTAANVSKKAFNAWVRDPLLLLHDYATLDAYATLRSVAAPGENPSLLFRNRLAYERCAGVFAGDPCWKSTVDEYPFMKVGWKNRARQHWWSLRERFG